VLETGFLDRRLVVEGRERRYVVYLPFHYSPERCWPVILALHGKGESGQDGLFQLWHGLARAIHQDRERWPFVCLFPQKADPDQLWLAELPLLQAVLEAAENEFALDPRRRYLTGLSQGGHGTLALAAKLSWRFAALAPVCGWTEHPEAAAEEIGSVPVWAFHGARDEVVPADRSQEVVEAIQQRGGNAKLTLYPEIGHDSWSRAYEDESLAEWLLEQVLDGPFGVEESLTDPSS
jgi:predicted peptidase